MGLNCTECIDVMSSNTAISTNSVNGNINCSCSGSSSGDSGFTLSCNCTRKTTESFADVTANPVPPNPVQGAAKAVASGLAGAVANAVANTGAIQNVIPEITNGAVQNIIPEIPNGAVVTNAIDNIQQSLQEDSACNKTPLHITIGILVTILIGLVAYIVYQQMKNKQQ